MQFPGKKAVAAIGLAAVAPWLIASASTPDNDNNTRVMITGVGDAPQKTRLITMQAGVSNFAVSAKRAWDDNAEAMQALRAALRMQGVKDADVRTTSLNLSPRTDYKDGDRRVDGFEVNHNLTVIFRDINSTGAVLDALVDAGAKQVQGPSFSWEAGDQALSIARAAAIKDANDRANFYAKALGLRVKRVVNLRDSGGYASGQPATIRTAYAEGAPTVVSQGEDVVRISVSGEYELLR